MFLKFLPLGNQHPRASAQVFLPTLSTQPFPSWSRACQLQTLKIEGHCGRTIQTWHLSLHVRDAVLEHWHLSVKFRNHCYIRQTSQLKQAKPEPMPDFWLACTGGSTYQAAIFQAARASKQGQITDPRVDWRSVSLAHLFHCGHHPSHQHYTCCLRRIVNTPGERESVA